MGNDQDTVATSAGSRLASCGRRGAGRYRGFAQLSDEAFYWRRCSVLGRLEI